MYLTKTDFKNYLDCSANFWFSKNKPEVLSNIELSDFDKALIEQGKEVEKWAQKLFPNAVSVKSFQDYAIRDTKKLLNDGATSIFQATFEYQDLYAMLDVLHLDTTTSKWNIYEVKGSSQKDKSKDEHLFDAAFQYYVATQSGFHIDQVNLIELNSEYVRKGDIDPKELLSIKDITEEVLQLQDEIRLHTLQMMSVNSSDKEPKSCDCIYKTRRNHCNVFSYLHSDIPEYSIHDISRISKKKLTELIELGAYALNEIPEDFKLTDIQQNQVLAEVTKNKSIKTNEIKDILDNLRYPLYFLDYETYPTAIPPFEGCKPYQQIPFQFSIHVQDAKGADLEHYEYLHPTSNSNPMLPLAKSLTNIIGNKGNIVVWNKSFEGKCHRDLAELLPEQADDFLGYNERFFDLMDIFSKQLYVHPEFKGRYSIKKVLPVLVPKLTYASLNIQSGDMAMQAWKQMTETEDQVLKSQIKADLLDYCELDTLAMVEIMNAL